MRSKRPKAVFFDRDGVLNFDSGYVYRSNDCQLAPDLVESLEQLSKDGFLFFVITNQSGVARGLYKLSDVENFHSELQKQLSILNPLLKFSEIYFCPHLPQGVIKEYSIECLCRKPGTLFLEAAQEKYQLDLSESWFVGDRENDIECGLAKGMRTIQVKTFGSKQYHLSPKAHLVCKTLTEATKFILTRR